MWPGSSIPPSVFVDTAKNRAHLCGPPECGQPGLSSALMALGEELLSILKPKSRSGRLLVSSHVPAWSGGPEVCSRYVGMLGTYILCWKLGCMEGSPGREPSHPFPSSDSCCLSLHLSSLVLK